MRLVIPPIVQTLLAIAMVFGLDWLFSGYRLAEDVLTAASVIAVMAGFAIIAYAAVLFRRSSTTVDPRYPDKSTAVVTSGIYAMTRNPMYLGMALIILAAVLWTGNPLGFAALIGFVGYMTEFQIKPEEAQLSKFFGDEYLAYKDAVRRWI